MMQQVRRGDKTHGRVHDERIHLANAGTFQKPERQEDKCLVTDAAATATSSTEPLKQKRQQQSLDISKCSMPQLLDEVKKRFIG